MDADFYRRLGDTPWNVDDLGAAFVKAAELHHTPHDDWNRRPTGLLLEKSDGSETKLTFNPDVMDNQIGLWLSAKFRKQKLPFEVRQCHMWRFFEVLAFIQDQGAVLREKGLVRDMADDPDGIEISEALVRVLATARYEGVRLQAGDPVPTFHFQRVVDAALAIEAEES